MSQNFNINISENQNAKASLFSKLLERGGISVSKERLAFYKGFREPPHSTL